MRRFSLVLVISLITIIAHTQESAGLTLGKYNGLSATYLNPALSLRYPHKWQVQIAGAQLFTENNYGYLHQSNAFESLTQQDQIQIADSDVPLDSYPLALAFKNEGSYFVDGRAQVLGPGFLYRLNHKTNIGLTAKARAFGTGQNLPASLNYVDLSSPQIDTNLQMSGFDINSAAWMEYQFHIAHSLSEAHSVGVNVKLMNGHSTAFFTNNFEYNYNRNEGSILQSLSDGSVEFGAGSPGGIIGVNGLGIDLGWTTNNIFGDESLLGISLLDVGMIRYSTPTYRATLTGSQAIDTDHYEGIDNIPDLISQLTTDQISIDSTGSSMMHLPTALSVQIVKPLTKHITIEAQVTQRVKYNKRQLARGNSLNISMIYDRKHFSAYLPVTLYNESDVRFGAAFRLFFLTVGSDHIMSLIGQSDFTGTDLYAKVHIYPFGDNNGGNKKPAIQCYY